MVTYCTLAEVYDTAEAYTSQSATTECSDPVRASIIQATSTCP